MADKSGKGAATNTSAQVAPAILVASDSSSDAALVKSLLGGAFDHVFTSTVADKAVEDFESRLPQVLVLAFDELAKAERYYLGLYRLSRKIQSQPHRTVILCDKDEVKEVAELCFKQSFDDYVLFWPMNHDAQRLRMSVHHALRDLAARQSSGPSAAEFAAQARRLAKLEALLDHQVAMGGQRIDVARGAIQQAEQDIDAALHGFSRRLCEGALPAGVGPTDATGLDREVHKLIRDEIHPPLRVAVESVQPVQHWVDDLRQQCEPHLESARALNALADRVRPIVLIVDDDDFQRKIVARILESENYELLFAASGIEALNVLGRSRPDLVLMDVLMPGMDGIETTRRIKAVPQLANLPVIMVTGKSEGNVVVDSLRAGAADFVVKPLDREKLISKVARWSRPKATPLVRR